VIIMNHAEFRTVLDWWMVSDPLPEGINKEILNDWLDRESQERGYSCAVVAYHEAPAP